MRVNDHKPLSPYLPNTDRYEQMKYRRCGKSGVLLPMISLGLWHNFGYSDAFDNATKIIRTAFDYGITHFDLANNYGPPYGSAEENFGRILKRDFQQYRNQLFISTKAGYDMWEGPYGDNGSRKYLMASCDESLQRLGLDYVDVFYHHRPDTETPLEETMTALADIVKRGKALYVGVSRYTPEQTKKASKILKDLGVPCLIHQPRYNMFDREVENGLLDVLSDEGIGSITFSPLSQGVLTGKYINGIPSDSRASVSSSYLSKNQITDEVQSKVIQLNEIANSRNQSLAQMALVWVLRKPEVTTVLLGVSKSEQLVENIKALDNLEFTTDELERIEAILA